MKQIILLSLLLISLSLQANMSEPMDRGNLGTNPFTSQYVDILHEDIYIEIDEAFSTANFNISYHINSEKDGSQIPLLFYAIDAYQEDDLILENFTITFDGKPIELKAFPEDDLISKLPLSEYNHFLKKDSLGNYEDIYLEELDGSGSYIGLHELRYFEIDIPKGEHKIQINYTATQWADWWQPIAKYSFRYMLSPAKYWKSFGSLNINLDARNFSKPLSSNLGKPISGDINSVAKWSFDELPVDIFQIEYRPKVSTFAKVLLWLSPFGIGLTVTLLLMLFHFYWMRKWRKKHPSNKIPTVVIIGGIIFPAISLISIILGFNLIRFAIGEHASPVYGYLSILLLIYYPIIAPIYLFGAWVFDLIFKRKLNQN